MTIHGNLGDMTVADLIQHACLEGRSARATIEPEQGSLPAVLFFEDGRVVHAELGDERGQEVIYRILGWEDGAFVLDGDVPSPTRTIDQDYACLLLAGAQRLDEAQQAAEKTQEVSTMATKKKGEQLTETLDDLLAKSTDIQGAAIVGIDGLVYAINVPMGKVDESMVGAVAAAVLGLCKRSAEQLGRGEFTQTLIQGDKGNIIVTTLDGQTLFVALTPANVNLGMAFAETRSATSSLAEIL